MQIAIIAYNINELCIKERRADAEVIAMYHKKHPGTNVTPLLRTPFMTEENSEYSDDNRRQDAYKKAGLTDQDIANGVKVLEQISLSWRSKKLRNTYHELDFYHNQKIRKIDKPSAPSRPRADLGRFCDEPPKRRIFRFMLSSRWVQNNPGIPVQVKRGGSSGFSDDKYSTDEYFQSSSSESDGQNALKKATIEEQEDQ
ncbi:hypothetical protein PHLCEN_2v11493 [Hermanssonia centrifuga]|uniref:Uncharacterized protein n=1 Tax=Hermanssonia centrifuga TaxID=98765 RepID=A0A2R6NJU2_9APHY|nr:hypothetical protein PHLCEN_2v11493 [Hermanssonia centrifuga]